MTEREKLTDIWESIKLRIKNENSDIAAVAFETWIKPLKVGKIENDTVYLLVPPEHAGNGIGINIIKKNYSSLFKVTISESMDHIYDIEFIEEDPSADYSEDRSPVIPEEEPSPAPIHQSNLNERYTFDTFVVGPNNQLAVSAAKAVVERPGLVYNPLFLYGGPGLGKTHLMHAIGASIIKKDPTKIVSYVTSENFTNEVINYIQKGDIQKLRDKYRSVDVLLLDDVQFIIGKESTQNEFFNSFNELHSQNKAIILSSDKPPKDLEILDERLRSRFEWGLTVDITPPDYETRMAILRQYATNQLGFEIEDEVIQYIASNISSNIRELEGALNKVSARKNLYNEDITIAVAEEAIKDMLKEAEPRKVTSEIIISEVAKYYEITKDAIVSSKRSKNVAYPRQICMYLCRELIDDMSFDDIGNALGGKDHATVMHGCNKIKEYISTNPTLKDDIEKLTKKIIPGK